MKCGACAPFAEALILQARLCDSVSGRYRAAENSLLTKHVVAAGSFAKDPGSTPGASTIIFDVPVYYLRLVEVVEPPNHMESRRGSSPNLA